MRNKIKWIVEMKIDEFEKTYDTLFNVSWEHLKWHIDAIVL